MCIRDRQLVAMGYEKNYQAEAGGQFAVRGGIIAVSYTHLDVYKRQDYLCVV